MTAAAIPDQIRQITKDVLSRAEFDRTTSWTQLLADRAFKWLRALADWSGRNPDLAKLLVIILSAILLLLIAHVVYTVVSEFISLRKSGDSDRRTRPLQALEGVAENWTDAFNLARAALDAGDVYKALWIGHRVLLSILDRTGRIKFVRWKTNTDYIRECRDAGEGTVALAELTAAYERVVYAHGNFDRSRAVELLGKVQELAVKAEA